MSDKLELGYETVSPFPFVRIEEARVQSFQAPIVDFPIGFRGGPLLSDEHAKFRHLRAWEPYDNPQDTAHYENRLAGAFTYAGPVYDHFGHFISEMVHRILPARSLGLPKRLLFVAATGNTTHLNVEGWPSHLRAILEFLEVEPQDVTVIDRNTIVETLFVPQQGAVLNGPPCEAYLDLLHRFATDRLDALFGPVRRPAKLYVSRSSLGGSGLILGERDLERQFEGHGFTIFHPERHAYPVQIDHYRKASILVFAEGSACHGAELLGRGMLNSTILLPRTGHQTPLFDHVLKPRSRTYAISTASRYLGTLFADPQTEAPHFHRGVSIVDPVRLSQELEAAGAGRSIAFSKRRYAVNAARDFACYLAIHRNERWSRNETIRLLRTFRTRILA